MFFGWGPGCSKLVARNEVFVMFSVMSSQKSRSWFQTFVVFTPTSGGVPF